MRLFYLLTLMGMLTGMWPDSAKASTVLYAFASDSPGSIYTIDAATGLPTFVTNLGSSTDRTDGDFLNNELYMASVWGTTGWEFGKVNLLNGAFTQLNDMNGDQWTAIAAVPSENRLYAVGFESHNLLSITPEGIATIIGVNFPSLVDMAYDANHDKLYGVTDDSLYTVDRKTGTYTYINYMNSFGDTGTIRLGLTYHPSLDLLLLNNGSTQKFYSVNPDSGELTWIADNGTGVNLDGLASVDLEAGGGAVPEPSGWLMGAGGFALLTVLRKRLRLG